MNKKFFGLISVILVFALCMSLLNACGKKTDNAGKDTENMSFEEIYNTASEEFSGNKNPVAIIVMEDRSVIAFEMYADLAPNTVANFISLANSGFYDGIIFHRVIDGFMIQTGDPQGTGVGGPGYKIAGEFSNNGFDNDLSHTPGVVSMARQGNQFNPPLAYDTAGSQFFICVADVSYSLDNDYAAFGKVISGMDKVYEIAKVATDKNDKPLVEQKMAYVRVDTHGVAFNEPVTIAE